MVIYAVSKTIVHRHKNLSKGQGLLSFTLYLDSSVLSALLKSFFTETLHLTMSSSSALNNAIPIFQGANFCTWQQVMGDYLKSQWLWFHVAALRDCGRGHPVEVTARALTQAEADAQVAWDADDILGLCLSPNLRTHLGNTARLMWESLNTTFGQPGVSAIFADYQAAISLEVTGGQNPQVEIQQLNTLFEHLAVNGMSISDPMQGMILLNTLPEKWDSVGMVYLQSTCQLTNVSFQAVREAVMAEFECTTCSSTIAVNKILAVKRKGKSPAFSEQKRAPNQAPPALVDLQVPKRRSEEVARVKPEHTK